MRAHRPVPMRLSGYWLPVLLVGAVCLAGCSATPEIKVLEPASGQPHDVVFVQGDERDFAQIVWDAGSGTEHIIPGGFLGAYMFSVPHEATPGNHDVVLQKNGKRSKP